MGSLVKNDGLTSSWVHRTAGILTPQWLYSWPWVSSVSAANLIPTSSANNASHKIMITLSPFQTQYIDEVIQLSRKLEKDPVPCSYWGLNSISAAQLLQNPHKKSVVALINKSVVGIGSVTRGQLYQQHLAELSIAIDSQYRKNGIARKIVSQLEIMAKEDGIELLKANISTNNLPSRLLFESLNYEHRATLFCEFKSPEFGEIDDCVYYKRLIPG